MLDPHVSRFWQATLLSGLMDVQGLTACWEAIAPGKREVLEHLDRRLARQAVEQKALTVWQAQQLLAGRTSGFKVDRYILLDLIGQGGMGRVYLARDTRLDRQVALKILSPERVSNPRAIARFQREARVGAQLQHENLVRIYDFGESNSRYYLVMEYIEGKTIGTLISEQGKMAPATAARLVQQIALGLEHAHRKGLIHRDVNPYNILVTRDGTAKLADLGLAIDLADDDHVTREGATVGTFDYVAPEQARHSHSADIRSDIYSLGCTIYHMCSGQVPFPSPSLPEKLFAHQALEPTPLDQLVPGLPKGLVEVIQRMMRKSPDERFATPIQVVQALEPYVDELSTSGNRDGATSPVQEPVAEHSTGSPPLQHGATEVPAPPQLKPDVAPAAVKSLAALNGPEIPPLPATETGSGGNTDEPPALASARAQHHHPSDPDFPLYLDLGPEPSLSEGILQPKPRPAVDHSNWRASAVTLIRRPASFWRWGLVALATSVMVCVGVLALVKPLAPARPKNSARPRMIADAEVPLKLNTDLTKTPQAGAGIIVRTDGANAQEFPAKNLYDAIQTAMGAHGWVELRNRELLRLTADQTLNFNAGQGRLVIRAAPGFQPVIEIELKDTQPLLTTGSSVALELVGVTIKVSYPQHGANPTPPAVIVAAGTAKIDRCAIQVTGGSHPKASRAILFRGSLLEINRSWLQGFDETIEIHAMSRTSARIHQTMIVPIVGSAQGQTSDWYGWGTKLQVGGRGGPQIKNPQPHLILEHCTVEAAGLIDVTSSSGSFPLEVDVNSCAIKTAALLACKQGIPPSSQVHWRGTGNQYDIVGPLWIVLSAHTGTPAFSDATTDLQSWSHFAPGDRDSIQQKLRFLSDTVIQTEATRPIAYKIQAPVGLRTTPGANPELVGPWSKP